MIPIRDDIPTRTTPVVNYLLIAANIIVYLAMASVSQQAHDAIVAQ